MGNKISRSSFLKIGAGAALSVATPFNILASSYNSAATISKITVAPVPGEFYRSIAMNAYDDAPKGITGETSIARIVLDDGTEGVGVLGYQRVDEETIKGLKNLLGVSPANLYQWNADTITGFSDRYRSLLANPKFAFIESPILDALGKVKEQPVWQLFGSQVRSAVDCYDGTLYFKDIELETDASVLGDLASRIKEDGYKAIKMKVGRPDKWMPGKDGLERDIEAFTAVKEAVGKNYNIMADANNGYKNKFDWGVQFLEECVPQGMYWMEEIFPESVDKYRRLHKELRNRNLSVSISEGETIQDIDEFKPYIDQDIMNIIQPDMRTVGFTNILRGSELAKPHNITLVPHNWQSEMGKIMSIHAAMIDKNITFAEDDRYDNFALDTSEYLFRDGQWIAPDKSGWGIELNNHYDYLKDDNEEVIIS